MEEKFNSPSQNNGVLYSSANTSQINNKHQGNDNENPSAKELKPQYSMPGILHFIQHEWARFELERSQWELDRAEFQVAQPNPSVTFSSFASPAAPVNALFLFASSTQRLHCKQHPLPFVYTLSPFPLFVKTKTKDNISS